MATTTYGTPYVSGTDLVANWPAASLTVANSIDAAGYYVGRGINAQTASYTTVLTDAGKTVTMTAAGANTVTIPANSSVAYVVGTRINILNLGAGACTPTAGAGVTINGTITALATNSSAAVIKTATNTWSYVPFGSGGAATLTSGDVTSTTGSPTITTSGGNTIYKFTGSGTIVFGRAGVCNMLNVGGGGGGGSGDANRGGGGGSGGYYSLPTAYIPSGATYTITVGAGGANNTQGNPSIFTSVTGSPGGGNGSNVAGTGQQQGAGGGGGRFSGAGAPGISPYGFAGATSTGANIPGGGGGSSAVGTTAAGGAGTANSITGASVTYAAGGGIGTGASGAANTGDGGFGSAVSANGGPGGSGLVIISVTT